MEVTTSSQQQAKVKRPENQQLFYKRGEDIRQVADLRVGETDR